MKISGGGEKSQAAALQRLVFRPAPGTGGRGRNHRCHCIGSSR